MTILKKDKHSASYKLLGVSIPQWLHNYLSLYCLAKNKTKSEVMQGWIDVWHTQTKAKDPQEKLIQEIIGKANVEWAEVSKKTDKPMVEFKDDLERELKLRGLNPFQINIILKGVK
jgi:hypothetical protein